MKDEIHKGIVKNLKGIEDWFEVQRKGLYIPFYASFDIRDSGYKVTNIDANLYPAGFNNICQADKDYSVDLAANYIRGNYGSDVKNIAILTEEHTQNAFYWENVRAIQEILERAGYSVQLAMPQALPEEGLEVMTASGASLKVHAAQVIDGEFRIAGIHPQVTICNNDFSQSHEEWARDLKDTLNPPRELGWYQRRKSTYFKHFNELVTNFAELIDMDPWHFLIRTERFEKFDVKEDSSREALAQRVDEIIEDMRKEYSNRAISQEPFVFVKNNAGTYGLGVIQVAHGDEVRNWNYKSKKKMKAAKGGGGIQEVVIQEGIRTTVRADEATAEPAIYMIGCHLAGGFLRAHSEKSETESLNSPGAVYRRLCLSDLNIDVEGRPLENVYGWIARLGMLAIGREIREMGIDSSVGLASSC